MHFYKYQGAGNDFVVIDNRENQAQDLDKEQVAKLCDRRFGIGADGLMLLQNHPKWAFEMRYFNADGQEASLCGNGGRCILAFAHRLGIFEQTTEFLAVDGPHRGEMLADGRVALAMQDVDSVEKRSETDWITDTGSPHYLRFLPEIANLDVDQAGQALRYSSEFKEKGINVNFLEVLGPQQLQIRTYERGVEAETLACGTGATAAALAWAAKTQQQGAQSIKLQALGGLLEVRFVYQAPHFTQIELIGPAQFVFEGDIAI